MEKKSFLIFVVTILLFLDHCSVSRAENSVGLRTDRLALEAFRARITVDPSGVLSNSWSANTLVCNWKGISCSFRLQPPRVVALDVSNMGFVGRISPHIGNLSFLTLFDITNNSFHGPIPPEISQLHRLKEVYMRFNNIEGNIPEGIGNLSRLQHLLLNQNQLTGSLPLTIFTLSSLLRISFQFNSLSGTLPVNMCDELIQLTVFYVSGNQLEGPIPSNIYKCRELRHLSMSINQFNGSIPREIGNLTLLKELYLGENNLQGIIPVEIGNLMSLEVFFVDQANLRGDVPHVIFNMSSLRIIGLANNSLSGLLPPNVQINVPNLEELFLHGNMFIGPLPSGLWKCKRLRILDLSKNGFTGNIPHEIGNLTLLSHLVLGSNKFTGVLPDEMGSSNQLEDLSLNENRFSGHIPFQLFNISTLKRMHLHSNSLSGNLPADMGFWLPNLEELLLGNNELQGTLPCSIGNASKLSMVDMHANFFTGFVPNTIGRLELLEDLVLGANFLTNEESELGFLSSLTNCRKLKLLNIAPNSFNGILPSSVGNLSTTLQLFQAYDGKIKGNIPSTIGNLSNLITLSLDMNELTGDIPVTLGKLQNLGRLYLEHNRLQGVIPDDLCLLKKLGELYLSDNQLRGSIPACLGGIESLMWLFLDTNKLTSTIPSTLWSHKSLVYLNLSSNTLTGSLSSFNQSLPSLLTGLDLSWNQLSGDIPSSIGSYQMLNNLSLAQNKLQGPIPESLGSLISLELLDLSNNNLSSVIPRSLTALKHLQYLNLSFNNLEGEIPSDGQFRFFTAMSFIHNKALCGTPRLEVALCKTKRSVPRALSSLRYILPIVASVVLVTILYLLRRGRKGKVSLVESQFNELFRVSYYEILRATEYFDETNLIGHGGYGSVFKGKLSNGVTIAVKVFNLNLENAEKSFDVECEVLRTTRHRNLVKIISSCTNVDFKCLVMAYMPNGNLDQWLYSHNNLLTFQQRLQIMLDVASAIEYLHHGQTMPIIHCDLKPSNVLLDEDMTARICDFGIAKIFGEGELIARTTTMGTIGYMAPEYGLEGVASTKGDVYSFGILLLETFTRKKPTDELFSGGVSLRSWVIEASQTTVFEVVDANLIEIDDENLSAKEESLNFIFNLAMDCTIESPERRINMEEAVIRLRKVHIMFLICWNKFR